MKGVAYSKINIGDVFQVIRSDGEANIHVVTGKSNGGIQLMTGKEQKIHWKHPKDVLHYNRIFASPQPDTKANMVNKTGADKSREYLIRLLDVFQQSFDSNDPIDHMMRGVYHIVGDLIDAAPSDNDALRILHEMHTRGVVDNSRIPFDIDAAMEDMDFDNLVNSHQNHRNGHVCKVCSSPMIVKSGKFGKFLACPNSTRENNHGTMDMPHDHEGKDVVVIDKETGEYIFEYQIPAKERYATESPIKPKYFPNAGRNRALEYAEVRSEVLSSRLNERSFRSQGPGFVGGAFPEPCSSQDRREMAEMIADEQAHQLGDMSSYDFDEKWGCDFDF